MARIALLLTAFVALSYPMEAAAQLAAEPAQEMSEKMDATKTPGESKGGSDFLIVPIPQSSPTLGSGATLVGAMFYNPKNEPEPWITGGGYMRTSNGSSMIALAHRMSLGGDRFRLSVVGGTGTFNMKFYGIGTDAGDRDRFIELSEKGDLVAGQTEYRLRPNLFAGLRFIYLGLGTSIKRENPIFPEFEIPREQFKSTMVSLGPVLNYDRRDNSLNTKNGEQVEAALTFSAPEFGSDFSHTKLKIFGNIFRKIGKQTVVAGRASLCGVSKGAPFFDLCFYGSSSDLRGYSAGQYRDRATWATQLELRQNLFWRIGGVLFGGVGGVAPSLGELSESKILPAVGAGLRFQPLKNNPINVRIDYAMGDNSNALYVSVGEAF